MVGPGTSFASHVQSILPALELARIGSLLGHVWFGRGFQGLAEQHCERKHGRPAGRGLCRERKHGPGLGLGEHFGWVGRRDPQWDLAKTSLREISCANYNHDVRAGESTPHFETLEDFLRVNRSTTSSAVRSVPSQQTRSSDEIVRRKSRQPASVLAAGVQASFLAGSAVGWRS